MVVVALCHESTSVIRLPLQSPLKCRICTTLDKNIKSALTDCKQEKQTTEQQKQTKTQETFLNTFIKTCKPTSLEGYSVALTTPCASSGAHMQANVKATVFRTVAIFSMLTTNMTILRLSILDRLLVFYTYFLSFPHSRI
uniref:Uncharacterized protein n=1 Tax=Glossina pallidipes TaxID=7398 RepID=A0A1B0ABU9_GLOPL